MTEDHTQLMRAVANTLWPHLRTGDHGWKRFRETRIVTPTGDTRAGSYSSARQMSNPSTYVEVLSITWKIIDTLWSDDWHGAGSWRITLDKSHADAALARLNAATIADYETALELSNCRKPFQLETDEDGTKRLTRNRNDGLVTNLTAAALEALAGAAELRRIPTEVEDALLTESDISLDAIRAALQLAGSDEP